MKKKMDKIYAKINEEMKLKADLSLTMVEFNNLKELLSKTALLEDYKELYQRVVPPIGVIQQQMTDFSKEHQQFIAVIRRFEENQPLFALKHEIIEYHNEVRIMCKEKIFAEYKTLSWEKIQQTEEFVSNLSQKLEKMKQVIEKDIQAGIKA